MFKSKFECVFEHPILFFDTRSVFSGKDECSLLMLLLLSPNTDLILLFMLLNDIELDDPSKFKLFWIEGKYSKYFLIEFSSLNFYF